MSVRRSRLALLGVLAAACSSPPPIDPITGDGAVEAVARAADRFLAVLPPELRAKAQRPFADAERTAWNFVPGRYAGVELGELEALERGGDRAQRGASRLATELLQALLSPRGLEKTAAIRKLENVLREREGPNAAHRDPGRYALLVCGEPQPRGTFAVRLQGHHVSLHFTFAEGLLVGATPHFLGSNPHRHDDLIGTQRVLGREEDLARELLASLDEAQRARVQLAATAPEDVFLRPGRTVAALGARLGVAAAQMSEAQQHLLRALIDEYAHNLRGELADRELQRLTADFDAITFAWAGGTEPGQGHYWRVHGPTFAIEYDNTQNGANHVHTVWRDLSRDFGGDVLREHHAAEHAGR